MFMINFIVCWDLKRKNYSSLIVICIWGPIWGPIAPDLIFYLKNPSKIHHDVTIPQTNSWFWGPKWGPKLWNSKSMWSHFSLEQKINLVSHILMILGPVEFSFLKMCHFSGFSENFKAPKSICPQVFAKKMRGHFQLDLFNLYRSYECDFWFYMILNIDFQNFPWSK